jgi:hypothetical protein
VTFSTWITSAPAPTEIGLHFINNAPEPCTSPLPSIGGPACGSTAPLGGKQQLDALVRAQILLGALIAPGRKHNHVFPDSHARKYLAQFPTTWDRHPRSDDRHEFGCSHTSRQFLGSCHGSSSLRIGEV